MKIKKWLRSGRVCPDLATSEAVLYEAGRLLDRAYSEDIVGEILFEGEDGKFYEGAVEFCISEANPEYVKEVVGE